jgi:hypothetical protein
LGAVTPSYEGARAIIHIVANEELSQDSIKSFSIEPGGENEEFSITIQNFLSKKNPDGFFPHFLQKRNE